MSDDEQLAEVVRIRPGVDIDDEQRMLRIKPRDFEQRFCQHHRTELVRETERAYCVDCGQEVPLFKLLQMLAQSVDKWIAYRQEAARRAKVAQANLADLLRRESNAKARVRSAVKRCPPCNSGEGCEESDTGDAARAEFIAWMRDQEYGFDGSDWEGSPLQWVEAAFGEEEHRPPKIVAEYADPARRDADEGL